MNKILMHKCMQDIGMSFIDNSSLDGTYLNGSNIHLNTKGSTILTTKFIKYLRSNKPPMSSRNDKNFRMSTVHQLEDLPRMVGVFSRHKYQEQKHS